MVLKVLVKMTKLTKLEYDYYHRALKRKQEET